MMVATARERIRGAARETPVYVSESFERMVAAFKENGLGQILDFVLNCPPFRPDSRRKQEGSRISLRIGLCRRIISGSN